MSPAAGLRGGRHCCILGEGHRHSASDYGQNAPLPSFPLTGKNHYVITFSKADAMSN